MKENAIPIDDNELGSDIDVRDTQSSNADLPIDVMELGSVIVSIDVHPSNKDTSIVMNFKFSGNVIDVREEHN